MYHMTDEEFEQAVEEALDTMPEQFIEALDNVAIVIRDEPEERMGAGAETPSGARTEILGFYDGIPLTERDSGYDFVMPDMIYVFKGPHERSFTSREEVVEEIRKTVVHEIGHFFGLDDEELYRMGY